MLSTNTMLRAPEVVWAQDRKSLFITVRLADTADKNPTFTKTDKSIEFDVVTDKHYHFALDLFAPIKLNVAIVISDQ
eukprot:jgi/Hompol1/6597/HPOL_003158-RA